MPKQSKTQELITQIEKREESLEERIKALEKQSRKLEKSTPWYQSLGICLSIILVCTMVYIIYVFYMSEHGKIVILPEWMWH